MLTARLAPEKIAETLRIDLPTLKAYLALLSAAADAPYPEVPPPPPRATPASASNTNDRGAKHCGLFSPPTDDVAQKD
jgi:hypothetical protein